MEIHEKYDWKMKAVLTFLHVTKSALLISRCILWLGQRGHCCFCAACPNRKMYLEIRSADEGGLKSINVSYDNILMKIISERNDFILDQLALRAFSGGFQVVQKLDFSGYQKSFLSSWKFFSFIWGPSFLCFWLDELFFDYSKKSLIFCQKLVWICFVSVFFHSYEIVLVF